MKTRFSKPSGDVSSEWDRLLREEAENLRRERAVSARLADGPTRRGCLLCAAPLAGAPPVDHRGHAYRLCPRCGHLQSAHAPSDSHRRALEAEIPFHAIYRPLEPAAFQSRVERIYRPKLDWILEAAPELGATRETLLRRRWVELGCGAGYFLKALRDAGATACRGLDRDPQLVRMANEILGEGTAAHFPGDLPEALRTEEAEAYAAFFVLEHVERLPEVLEALRGKPQGTLFCFAVPVLGLGALLEGAFPGHYARNLDSGVHTQLFTDRSIAHALDAAGYRPVAQWVFGQDASDLVRLLLTGLSGRYPEAFLEPLRAALARSQDSLQAALDREMLADSRHVLAVKK